MLAPAYARGSESANTDPWGPVSRSSARPPCSSATARTMARPSPVPPSPCRVVANRSNSLPRIAGSTPLPWSRTCATHSGPLLISSSTRAPSGECCTAFPRRFSSARRSQTGSPRTGADAPARSSTRTLRAAAVGPCASTASRATAQRSTGWSFGSMPRASRRASESRSWVSCCSLSALSRIRSAKRRAVSGWSAAPSVSTSAEARIAATGFFSSCDTSATKVSSACRSSSSRRIDSSACVSSRTSRPRGSGSGPWRSPAATRCAARVRRSMGAATAPPISMASAAEATANMNASSATLGATSLISCTMPKVALRTRTRRPPATGASADTRATPGCASPASSSTCPSESRRATSVSMALRVKAWRMGRSESRGVRAASSAIARASSSAARIANSEARAVKRSITIIAKAEESSSVVAASGMNTWSRRDRPVRRAPRRRTAVAPTPRRNNSARATSSSCLSIPQTVSHPAHSLQHARVATRLLDLAPQRLHVHVHRPVADHHVAAPHRLEDLAALEHPPRTAQEQRQQIELGPGEPQLAIRDRRLSRAGIEGERAGADRLVLRLGRLGGPAQHRAYARRDLARGERLEHVVVGAKLQADHAVRLLVTAGEDDHGHVTPLPQRAEEREPAPVRQHEVEDHEVGAVRETARLAQRGGLFDLEAVAPERESEALADGRLIVDEEDRCHLRQG